MNTCYEFNNGTLAVLPNGKDNSLVYEDSTRYLIEESPLQIMEESCKYFGSSYEGRRIGAKEILGAEYKVPVVVEDSSNIIAFPTTSPQSEECAWISLGRVDKIERVDVNNTKIIFDNRVEIIVPCSYRTIENQLSRASRLNVVLSKRKNG